MTDGQIIGLVTVAGCLVLSIAELRSNRVGKLKTLAMALLWIAIIGAVALVFGSMQ